MSKWLPTTKFCPCCGALNDIGDEETYVCECGYKEDRDVHASKNIKLFGSTKRDEWLEQPSAEVLATTCLNLCCSDGQVDADEAKIKKSTSLECSIIHKRRF